MDFLTADTFIAEHVLYFETGDLTRLLRFYKPPLAVYFRNQVQVFSDTAAFSKDVVKRRETYTSAGVLGISGTTTALELVRDKQFRLWVQWDYRFADRIEHAATQSIYYCRQTPDGPEVQIAQTTHSYLHEIGVSLGEQDAATRPASG